MEKDELRLQVPRHVAQTSQPTFLEQEREKVHLEKKVAELVEQLAS